MFYSQRKICFLFCQKAKHWTMNGWWPQIVWISTSSFSWRTQLPSIIWKNPSTYYEIQLFLLYLSIFTWALDKILRAYSVPDSFSTTLNTLPKAPRAIKSTIVYFDSLFAILNWGRNIDSMCDTGQHVLDKLSGSANVVSFHLKLMRM